MSNIKLKNLFVCENVIVSQSGQPSLINLIAEINSSAFPAIYPKITVLVSVSGNTGFYKEKIELVSVEDNKIVAFVENTIEIKDNGVSNFIGNFVNTIFPKDGKYWFKVSIDGNVISKDIEDSYLNLNKK